MVPAKTTVYCQGNGSPIRAEYLRDDQPDGCRNEGRYLTENGERFCGLCDAERDATSIRISDLPALLRLLGDLADRRIRMGWARDTSDYVQLTDGDLDDMLKLISKRGVTFK